MPATPPSPAALARRRQLAAIHTLKARLGLDDDTYRALLADETGETSAARLSEPARLRVVARLRRLEEEVLGRSGGLVFLPDDPPRLRKVKSLWIELARAGRIERASQAALDAWVKTRFDVDRAAWLRPRDLSAAIEQLKSWLQR